MLENNCKQILFWIAIIITLIFSSCSGHKGSSSTNVKDSVRSMISNVEKDLMNEGPKAWLKYFASKEFTMASNGKVIFPDRSYAEKFINDTLSKMINKVELKWDNIKIDSLSITSAFMSATYRESLSDISGNKIPVDGYFTSLLIKEDDDWKLSHLHWSINK